MKIITPLLQSASEIFRPTAVVGEVSAKRKVNLRNVAFFQYTLSYGIQDLELTQMLLRHNLLHKPALTDLSIPIPCMNVT
jgi:hypothetical protein